MKIREIDNTENIIDSCDIITRISELEDMIEADEISEDNGATPQLDENEETIVDMVTCGECGKSWNDALMTDRTPAPSARCPYESIHEEIEELKILKALEEEASGSPDWIHGEALIRDSYFEDYARQTAEDCGMLKDCDTWPARCINWKQAAEELQQDYTSVDFDGITYWIRS